MYAWLVLALIMFLCFEFRRPSLVKGKEGVIGLYSVQAIFTMRSFDYQRPTAFLFEFVNPAKVQKKLLPLFARSAPPRPVPSCPSTSFRERPPHFCVLKFFSPPRFLVFSQPLKPSHNRFW